MCLHYSPGPSKRTRALRLAFVLAAPQTSSAASRSAAAVRRILCAADAVGSFADLDSSSEDDEDDDDEGAENVTEEDAAGYGVENGAESRRRRAKKEKNYKAEAKAKARAIERHLQNDDGEGGPLPRPPEVSPELVALLVDATTRHDKRRVRFSRTSSQTSHRRSRHNSTATAKAQLESGDHRHLRIIRIQR